MFSATAIFRPTYKKHFKITIGFAFYASLFSSSDDLKIPYLVCNLASGSLCLHCIVIEKYLDTSIIKYFKTLL
jgi:hypothetical protein